MRRSPKKSRRPSKSRRAKKPDTSTPPSPAAKTSDAPPSPGAPFISGSEPGPPLPIVGIVASAGGLNAFIRLLDAMPPTCGVAFVLVPHLDPKRESFMPEILGRHTQYPVVTASTGDRVSADRVYVIPPDKTLTIAHGVLELSAADPRSPPGALDAFLRSLAQDQQERAIGIVLSGTGSSGTAGIKEIKSNGGMVMVQAPSTAEQASMPRSAIATGLADFVLPPEKMPQALIGYVRHFFASPGADRGDATLPVEDALTKVLALLRARARFDFRSYRRRMLQRRIHRRMGLAHVDTMITRLRAPGLLPIPGPFSKLVTKSTRWCAAPSTRRVRSPWI